MAPQECNAQAEARLAAPTILEEVYSITLSAQ